MDGRFIEFWPRVKALDMRSFSAEWENQSRKVKKVYQEQNLAVALGNNCQERVESKMELRKRLEVK